jgi:signal transduction histidine kinase
MSMVNVLIAEKSNAARQAIVDAIARLDAIEVQGAVADLRSAVRAICQRTPDLVITGVELEDASGLELIEAARQLAPASHLVVVGPPSEPERWRRQARNTPVQFVAADPALRELRAVVAALASSAPGAPGDAASDDAIDDQLRLLGRIAAGVAHDLGNYLGAASALLALLETAPADPELLARAGDALDQARRLTGSLVGYVRGDAAQFERVDLGAVVERTLALVAPLLPHGVAVRTDVAPELRLVRGVAAELEQLVINLVLNAADAMPGGGELAIRILPSGVEAIYLEVTDTGSGIPADALVTRRGRTASRKSGQRTGLGLGIVRRVVDHHGGSIRFAPRIDRTGTIVWVLLPTD